MLFLSEKTWSTIPVVIALEDHAFAFRMLENSRHRHCGALHYFKVVSYFSTTNSGHFGLCHMLRMFITIYFLICSSLAQLNLFSAFFYSK